MLIINYSSYAQKLKAKDSEFTKKAFVYQFELMDLSTRMYVCFGSSLISEKQAFDKVMQMLKELKLNYLREYFKRVNSENGFAQDKRMCGDRELIVKLINNTILL